MQRSETTRPEERQLNVRIPADLHKAAKTEANKRDMTLGEFVAAAIRCELKGSHEQA